jgi:hypothetical protein
VACEGAGDMALCPSAVSFAHATTSSDEILKTILLPIIKDIISRVKEYRG